MHTDIAQTDRDQQLHTASSQDLVDTIISIELHAH